MALKSFIGSLCEYACAPDFVLGGRCLQDFQFENVRVRGILEDEAEIDDAVWGWKGWGGTDLAVCI